MLVLLDNAHNEEQVRPLLPGNSGSALVVTSRQHVGGLEGLEIVDLGGLTEKEALDLLVSVTGAQRVRDDLEAARQIIDLCVRLPLAVRMAGGRLKAGPPARTVAEEAAELAREGQRLQSLAQGNLDVRASFIVSYRDLDT